MKCFNYGYVSLMLSLFFITFDEAILQEEQPIQPHCGRSGKYHGQHQETYGQRTTGRPLDISRRIVGGETSQAGEWPWQVSFLVRYYNSNGTLTYQAFCGGSLISNRWILTAGHCAEVFNSSSMIGYIRVRLGEHNLQEEEHHQYEYRIDKVIIHEQMQYVMFAGMKRSLRNDVALVRLSTPAVFGDYVNVICLPSENEEVPPGTPSLVSGWGRYNVSHGEGATILKHLRVSVLDSETCSKGYGFMFESEYIYEDMICTKADTFDSTACNGDSGGPLIMYNAEERRWIQIGIVSFGPRNCVREGVNAVYARVTHFMPWIEQTIAANDAI